jgi:uncharacterized membrane protein
MTLQKMTKWAVITALYVALTYLFYSLSYHDIQFRIAEVLMLLAFFKKDYAIPLILGCAIANLGSPLGWIDVGIGTLGTVLGLVGIIALGSLKKLFSRPWIPLFIASLFPVISNAFLVGWELNLVYGWPFWLNVLWVAIGEFAVVSVLGVALFAMLSRNRSFFRMITTDEPFKSMEGPDDSPEK